jgi:hypothetical protein
LELFLTPKSAGAADLGGARPAAASRAAFQLSRDPAVAAKLRDVVGLYLDPPAHSLVLSVDEKSQIQALDRPCLNTACGSTGKASTSSSRCIGIMPSRRVFLAA